MMATHKVETEKHADVMIAKVCKKAFAKGTTLCIKVCLGLEYQVLKIRHVLPRKLINNY